MKPHSNPSKAGSRLDARCVCVVGLHAADSDWGGSNACWHGEQGQDCLWQHSSDL